MTTVAAIAAAGKVWMAADSLSNFDGEKRQRRNAKIVRSGEMLIGASGAGVLAAGLTSFFKPAAKPAEQSDEDYLNTTITAALRACFEQVCGTHPDSPDQFNGGLLIGYHGQLYRVSCDYGMSNIADGFDAIGSGATYALGALAVLTCNRLNPDDELRRGNTDYAASYEAWVQRAVAVASYFDVSTGGAIATFCL